MKNSKNLSKAKTLALATLASLFMAVPANASSGDLAISGSINFSDSNFLEGKPVQIYATAINPSSLDLKGLVRFYDNNSPIGADQSVAIIAGGQDSAFTTWTPQIYGAHKITVEIIPWEEEPDNPINNLASIDVMVKRDTDRDGIANENDNDDDNDGTPDLEDHFPLDASESKDSDGDSIGDNADPDDDNDGVPDETDDLPSDPDETIDTDKDGIGDSADKDDDNDGLSDSIEENLKTNPLLADTDGDGVNDGEDKFPLDPSEWEDHDGDKIGNNLDEDDDNDGIIDSEDPHPLNKPPTAKINELDSETLNIKLLEKIIFDASGSSDSDGEIVKYIWKLDEKNVIEGKAFKKTFDKVGSHKVKLEITDNYGETTIKNLQINVSNNEFKIQTILFLLTTLLACLIIFKYTSGAKFSKKK